MTDPVNAPRLNEQKYNKCLRIAAMAVTSLALGGEPSDLSIDDDVQLKPPAMASVLGAAADFVVAEVEGTPPPAVTADVQWICSSRFRTIAALATWLYERGSVSAAHVRDLSESMTRSFPLAN